MTKLIRVAAATTLAALLCAGSWFNATGTASAAPSLHSVGSATSGLPSEEYVKNCGIVSCTKYYTRAATIRINQRVQEEQNRFIALGAASPAVACAVLGVAIGSVADPLAGGGAAAACGAAAADKIATLVDALKQAADAGQCFAMRTPKGVHYAAGLEMYVSDYLVRSNRYCTDGS